MKECDIFFCSNMKSAKNIPLFSLRNCDVFKIWNHYEIVVTTRPVDCGLVKNGVIKRDVNKGENLKCGVLCTISIFHTRHLLMMYFGCQG